MDRLKPGLTAISILGLLFTLIVMFALKGDLILERPAIVIEMAIPMILFFLAMFFTVLFVGWRLRFSLPGRGRRRLQRHRARLRDRDRHRDHRVLPDRRPGDRRRTADRGPGDAVPRLGGIRLAPRWFAVTPGETTPPQSATPARTGGVVTNGRTAGRAELRLAVACAGTSSDAVRVGALVGDPVRASILAILRDGPHCVCNGRRARGAPEQPQQPPRRLREGRPGPASRHGADARWVYYERDEAAIAAAIDALRAVLR